MQPDPASQRFGYKTIYTAEPSDTQAVAARRRHKQYRNIQDELSPMGTLWLWDQLRLILGSESTLLYGRIDTHETANWMRCLSLNTAGFPSVALLHVWQEWSNMIEGELVIAALIAFSLAPGELLICQYRKCHAVAHSWADEKIPETKSISNAVLEIVAEHCDMKLKGT
jgi:hypothetical protein